MDTIRRSCRWEDGGRSILQEVPIESRHNHSDRQALERAVLAQANESTVTPQGIPSLPFIGSSCEAVRVRGDASPLTSRSANVFYG
jgi:hypothetical protein